MKFELARGRIRIVLHQLQAAGPAAQAGAPALLLLHELGGSAADWGSEALDWSGAVFALDFAGHGDSQWLRSSVYYPELFLGDADVAQAHVESTGSSETCLLGRGIGGYVAMLLAGARPDRVRAAGVLPGRGFDGAGNEPAEFGRMEARSPRGAAEREAFDPRVARCEEHVRPSEYAASFATRARNLYFAQPPGPPPAWWASSAQAAPGRCEDSVKSALLALAASPPIPSERAN